MANKLKYGAFNTRMGWIGVLRGDKGLIRTTLPCRHDDEALTQLGKGIEESVWSPDFFTDLRERLTAYFEGTKVGFADELDFTSGTSFQQAVWRMTQLIPYGETRSYKWVSEAVGKAGAARAVGQALHQNPLPIIVPCHRVIASNRSLCGFGGGLAMKRALLHLENPAVY
ncbi:MAG: MGMT family protein [Chloroflexota bacterium]